MWTLHFYANEKQHFSNLPTGGWVVAERYKGIGQYKLILKKEFFSLGIWIIKYEIYQSVTFWTGIYIYPGLFLIPYVTPTKSQPKLFKSGCL